MEESELIKMLRKKDEERLVGEFVPFQGKRVRTHTDLEDYDPAWMPGGRTEEK